MYVVRGERLRVALTSVATEVVKRDDGPNNREPQEGGNQYLGRLSLVYMLGHHHTGMRERGERGRYHDPLLLNHAS